LPEGESFPNGSHLSGISTLKKQVAGLHRACPSASLDKIKSFYHIYDKISIGYCRFLKKDMQKVWKEEFLQKIHI